jgi:hypothetical protein
VRLVVARREYGHRRVQCFQELNRDVIASVVTRLGDVALEFFLVAGRCNPESPGGRS